MGKEFNRKHIKAILKPYLGADGHFTTDEPSEDDPATKDCEPIERCKRFKIDRHGVWPLDETDATDREMSEFGQWRPVSVFLDGPDEQDVVGTPMLPFPFTARDLAAFMAYGVGVLVAEHYGDWADGPDPDRLNDIPQHENFARLAVKSAFDAYREAERAVDAYPLALIAEADRAHMAYKEATKKANIREGAGGDRSRVYFVDSTRISGESLSFDPARDMKALQAAAERIGDVKLIVVDPIVSAVTGDSHKNTETRRALQPLVDLAASMNAALIGITHFSKGGQGGDPSQRVMGSVAFTAVARVVLVAAKVKGDDGEDKRILARSKSNIGPDDGGYQYNLEQAEPLPGIHASYVTWGSAVVGSAAELLSNPTEQDGEEKGAQNSANDFLEEMLKDCPVCSKDLEAQAKIAGISWRTIRRASDTMGILKKPAADKRWYWRLPNLSKNGNLSNLSNLSNLKTLDNMDNMDNMAELIPFEAVQ